MKDKDYSYGEVRNIPEDVDETRTIPFVISTYAKDRHGTVLNQNNWKLENFNKNGIVGYQHNVWGGDMCNAPDPDDVIGKGRAYLEGDTLMGEVKFETSDINEKAEKIFKKVKFGSLRATSVGFVPFGEGKFGDGEESRGGKNETYYYEGQELLEFSIVNIPSNPEALKKSFRNGASNAVMFLRKIMPQYSFSQIEKMTIGDAINVANGIEKDLDPVDFEEEIKKLQMTIKTLEGSRDFYKKHFVKAFDKA